MATIVTGNQYRDLDGQLFEIKRQLRQKGGYPYNPKDLGRALQEIVEGRFNIMTIDRSQPFNPAEFLGNGWTIWKGPVDGDGLVGEEEQDGRSLAITELDPAKIQFVTMLKDGDNGRVQGEEKLRRLKAAGHTRLDAMIFQTFWRNKGRIPEDWKKKGLIAFEGTELRSPSGGRCVLFLYWVGVEWRRVCVWLEFVWRAFSPSAVLAE